ncbi:hypothetical protein [Fodinicola feengrottensis]|uniref:hypothetical protein n=1 Tax=Fodinicola feengrottensis TaxID=435914 RepID=UPI0013D7F996|nr:hypothetical protein [Fodinicola feengrottensis]
MEEQLALDRLVIDEYCPAATGDLVTLVSALPGELDTDPAVPLGWPAVQPATDGDEPKLAAAVPGELDETWFDQVDGVDVARASISVQF